VFISDLTLFIFAIGFRSSILALADVLDWEVRGRFAAVGLVVVDESLVGVPIIMLAADLLRDSFFPSNSGGILLA
jgi:hypothetical protein